MLNIRKAAQRDIPRIGRLLEQVNALHHEGRPDLFRLCRKYDDEQLAAILTDPSRPIFVAADEADTVQGYAFCVVQDHTDNHAMTPHRTLYIDDICVDEHCRGRRVGTLLCQWVVDYARREGFHNVTLNVWTCNPGARTFYEKCGFAPQKVGMEIVL